MLITTQTFISSISSSLPLLFAQADYSDTASSISPVEIILFLIAYLIAAYFCQTIFAKCGVPNPWYAWIPVLGTYAAFQAGDEENPTLWTILSLIPCINIVAIVKMIIAWTKICKKLGKSPWLLLVALVPFGSLFLLGYLAFG
jgi:Family of unknown function (DUF5684)